MTSPRRAQVSVADTPYYHVVSRCVRRTFLCGFDQQTQTSYEHRRLWIEERIHLLSTIFCIQICAYAVMSNHYHLVVKLAPEESESWNSEEIIRRWTSIFKGPLLVQQWLAGKPLSEAQKLVLDQLVEEWRIRLCDLGWFMKCLNEPIARQANREDNCTGHFWESRYKSQALLDEEALLSCMAYVDLNPIRAGIADTPESSDHTSIKNRIQSSLNIKSASEAKQIKRQVTTRLGIPAKPLLHFDGHIKDVRQSGLPFSFEDYLHLIDWTGRIVRGDKSGHISSDKPPILDRLNIRRHTWLRNSAAFEANYRTQFRRPRLSAA